MLARAEVNYSIGRFALAHRVGNRTESHFRAQETTDSRINVSARQRRLFIASVTTRISSRSRAMLCHCQFPPACLSAKSRVKKSSGVSSIECDAARVSHVSSFSLSWASRVRDDEHGIVSIFMSESHRLDSSSNPRAVQTKRAARGLDQLRIDALVYPSSRSFVSARDSKSTGK